MSTTTQMGPGERVVVGARDQLGYGLWATLGVTAAFAVLCAHARLLAGPFLAMDDAKTRMFAQVWQWGYQPDNPPLFEWLVRASVPLTGGGLETFLVIKYVCLVLAAAFVHLAVRLYADDRAAFGTAVGLVLLYQVGWNFHQAFTHSAILLPAVSALIWAFLRALQRPGTGRVAVLGLVVGISLLTKYNAALAIGGLFLSALAVPATRAVVLRPVFLLVPLIAGLFVLPHALWFLEQTERYRAELEVTLGLSGTRWERVTEGLVSLLVAAVSYFLPYGLVAGWLGRGLGMAWAPEERFLVRTSVLTLLGLAVAVAVVGIGNVSERYLIPVMTPAYVGLTSALIRSLPRLRGWLGACAGMAVLVVGLKVAQALVPGPPLCDDCREFVPYEALREPITRRVPKGAILIVRDENTGGNLVTMFPDSPVRVTTSFRLINPIHEEGLPCWFVWSEDMADGNKLDPPFWFAYDDPQTEIIDAEWRHPLREPGFRRTVWGLTPIDGQAVEAQVCRPAAAR